MRCLSAFLLFFSISLTVHAQENEPAKKPITLPGVEADGVVRMPNSWSIKPVGKQIELGDFPISIALHPSGKWAAILHAGYGDHEIIIVDLAKKKEHAKSRVVIEQTFGGLAFTGKGDTLYVGGGEFDRRPPVPFEDGFLFKQKKVKVADAKFIPGSLAAAGDMLYVPGVFGHAVAIVGPGKKDRVTVPMDKGQLSIRVPGRCQERTALCQPLEQGGRRGHRSEKERDRADHPHRKASDRNGVRPRRENALRRLLQLDARQRHRSERRQAARNDQLRPLRFRSQRQHAQQPVPDARWQNPLRRQCRQQ